MLVLNASSVAAIWLGADRIASGQLQIGEMIAFLSYLVQILMAVMLATFMLVLVPRASVCADRIQEVLDTESSVVPPEHPVTEVTGRGSLELRDVSFHYPGADEPVLDGISFTSLAGQTTAIIGSTGAGKTTLVNLVARLADPTAGEVLMDGVDIRQLSPDLLWSRIGLVPQRPYLFSGTVASNLRYGNPSASDDELWTALEIAQARSFVEAMPGGLDAPIHQGGTNVSGGQRQRLAIARAVVRRPEIYLFDDSFSALDLATDARLRAALAPVHRRQHGDRRRPARVDDQDRRPDPRARGRPHGRAGHAPRAVGHVPDVRRDRRVADDDRGSGVSDDDDRRRAGTATSRRRAASRATVTPSTGRRRPRCASPVPGARSACRPRSRRTWAPPCAGCSGGWRRNDRG